jgi:DNA-binding LacI/PurR family transcriptional regulator
MSTSLASTSNLELIAKRLEGDLRARGLREGDRYLTVAEVSDMLGVSRATAHRAIGLLVERGLLQGQHGRGTFVGPRIGKGRKSVSVRTVFVLMPEQQIGVSGVQVESILTALTRAYGGIGVQFGLVPREGSLEYVRSLIETAQQAGILAGAIPISCSRSIYVHLAKSGVPVVVLGSVYHDQQDLPSVDVDYHQAGCLLAQHLLERGHRRIALLSTGEGRPGDNSFYDGISQAITDGNLPHNALVMRIYPGDHDALRVQVRDLLSREERPTAVIAGSPRFVPAVESVAGELKLSIPRQLDVVCASQSTPDAEALPYTHVQPQMPFAKVAEAVADMLKRLSDGIPLERSHVVVPVELKKPSR